MDFFAKLKEWWSGPTGDMVSTAQQITIHDSSGRGLALPSGSAINWTRSEIVCGEHRAVMLFGLDNIQPQMLDKLESLIPGCAWKLAPGG